jgi:hypothetical protein
MRVFILCFRYLVPAGTLRFNCTALNVAATFLTFSQFQKLILNGNWPEVNN